MDRNLANKGGAETSGPDLFQDVVSYALLGDHRTATPADRATSAWIGRRLEQAGLDVFFFPWRLRQFFVERAELVVEARARECLPLWFPRPTGPEPVRAPLVFVREEKDFSKAEDRVALVKFNDRVVRPDSDHGPLIAGLAEHGARAVVGFNASFSGEIMANNVAAPFSQTPWPVPVVQVGAQERLSLIEAAGRGAEASVLVTGRDEPDVEAANVVGRLSRGPSYIVVSTPQSGWFRCAGERGSGVALFLALARFAALLPSSGPSWLFLSNSGHELDNMGMHRLLDSGQVPAPGDVLCWLHLGASIAVHGWRHNGRFLEKSGPSTATNLVTVPAFLPLLERSFEDVPIITPRTGEAAGELGGVMAEGYRAFGFFGGHYFFHGPSDGPESTGPELLEPVGRALVRTLTQVLREAGKGSRTPSE